VKLLLAAGADQTSRTASGATGLHIAANSGSADVIADLLESSEDVDPDDDGAYNCESKEFGVVVCNRIWVLIRDFVCTVLNSTFVCTEKGGG
jgi:hypothetical protein